MLAVGVLVLASFVFSDSLWKAVSRRRSIGQAERELASLTDQLQATQKKIHDLKTDPRAYEPLVRKELGYLRPAEKEARFIKKDQ